jgi:SulP family sulfate permease
VVLSRIHQQPLQLLTKEGFIEVIGRPNFCPTFDNSLQRAEQLLRDLKNPGGVA